MFRHRQPKLGAKSSVLSTTLFYILRSKTLYYKFTTVVYEEEIWA